MMDRRCNLIGIGAQKCATTWLHRVLQAHRQVAMSEPKELDFFSHHFDRGYEWYEQHFGAAAGLAYYGEISPSYFYNSDVPSRMNAYNPYARVVLILRDPVERAFSNHLHEVRAGNTSLLDFGEALQNNPAYLLQSRYGEHLARWRAAIEPDRFKILLHEDIRNEPWGVLSGLCDWLGLEWSGEADFAVDREANASATYKLRAMGDVTHALAVRLRAAGFGAALESVKKLPPVRAVLEANRQELRELVPTFGEEQRHSLAKTLQPDMEVVAEALGRRDLPWHSLKLARAASLEC